MSSEIRLKYDNIQPRTQNEQCTCLPIPVHHEPVFTTRLYHLPLNIIFQKPCFTLAGKLHLEGSLIVEFQKQE